MGLLRHLRAERRERLPQKEQMRPLLRLQARTLRVQARSMLKALQRSGEVVSALVDVSLVRRPASCLSSKASASGVRPGSA